jgi:hypothetical protein
MYGAGITNESLFSERALSAIREFMLDDRQQFVQRTIIAPACESVHFAKALNRSVTGSMKELILTAEMLLAEDDMSPHDLGFRLNDTLLSALAMKKFRGYGKPREAFRQLAGRREATRSGEGP